MGEYAVYHGEQIKIGTCESMFYLRFDQRKKVGALAGNVDPVRDVALIRFRFPFPDEDDCEPGSDFWNHDFERGVEIPGYVPSKEFQKLLEKPVVPPIKVIEQRLVFVDETGECHTEAEKGYPELQIVVTDSDGEHDFNHQMFRLSMREAASAVECLVSECDRLMYPFNEVGTDPSEEVQAQLEDALGMVRFYVQMGRRMMAGYVLNPSYVSERLPV